MHICVSKLTTIVSDNGFSPGQCQVIIWTNTGILSIGLLGMKFNEILIKIPQFLFKKMHLKMSSARYYSFCLKLNVLTLWGRVTHICVNKLTIIGSDNGLSPERHQAIIWTNVGILLVGPLRTNFTEFSIKIHTFSFKRIHFKRSFEKWRPSCLSLNVLSTISVFNLNLPNPSARASGVDIV